MTRDAIANLAALALRLADAHRAERESQDRYTGATQDAHRCAAYSDSDQFIAAQAAQERAFREHKAAMDAKRRALDELVAVADEWNKASETPEAPIG